MKEYPCDKPDYGSDTKEDVQSLIAISVRQPGLEGRTYFKLGQDPERKEERNDDVVAHEEQRRGEEAEEDQQPAGEDNEGVDQVMEDGDGSLPPGHDSVGHEEFTKPVSHAQDLRASPKRKAYCPPSPAVIAQPHLRLKLT